tara:strand:+ start:3018 stop:4433 length:1416 start_codon:yes stop_codon:yes gene_type:complete
MKKNLFFIFLIISSFSFSQEKWTLEMCVKRAIDENISIKQSELDYVDAEISRKNAIGNFIPNVNVGSSHSWNVGLNQNITTGLLENITTQFSSMNLNLGIDVYNGLKNIKQLHLANLRILSSQFQLADMKEDISLLVANSYLQILFNKEFIKIQESQLELSKSEVERAKELVENGVIPKGDLYEFEANLAGVEKTLIDAQNNFALSKISLAQLLLLDNYQTFDIADKEYELQVSNILDKSPEEIFAVAVSTKNEIKLFETNLDIAKKNLELNKSFLQPRLSAFYSYSTRIAYSDRLVGTGEFQNVPIGFVENTNQRVLTPVQKTKIIGAESFSEQFDRNAGQNFGLSLSIPILNNFSVRSNVDRSKVNILRNENQLLQKKLDLENTINQAHKDAQGAMKAYTASKKSLESRKLSYDYARDKFELGAMSSFDFTQVKQRFESAQSDLITSKFDFIFKIKVLEFYFGVPISID